MGDKSAQMRSDARRFLVVLRLAGPGEGHFCPREFNPEPISGELAASKQQRRRQAFGAICLPAGEDYEDMIASIKGCGCGQTSRTCPTTSEGKASGKVKVERDVTFVDKPIVRSATLNWILQAPDI